MQNITKKQIHERWVNIPEGLKEIYFSPEVGEILWHTCEEAGLSEEIIKQIASVVGNTVLGFIHVNDLAKELGSIPGIDQKAIDPIIFQIDKRIFEPVKTEILKLYATVSSNEPHIVAQEAAVPMAAGSVERVTMPIAETPAMISTEHGPATAVPMTEAAVEIRKVRIGEDIQKEATGAAEGPTIIHTEVDLVPVAQKRRALSSFGGMFGFKRGEAPKRVEPAVAAQVSMIEGLGKKPDDIARTAQQPVKVVHYTSAKAPEDMFGQQATQQQAPAAHAVNFEPKVVDLMGHGEQQAAQMSAPTPVPAMPDESRPIASMPKAPEAVMMKTPQRVETSTAQTPPAKEPQLAEIPVRDDIVDLRMLERVEDKK